MKSLEQFMETIKVADESIGDEYTAYKMDSTDNDMRKMAKLGTCHCCDYFLLKKDFIILIEETRLLETVENIRSKYSYLEKKHRDEFVNVCIRQEMELKVYGAMLVLFRLSEHHLKIQKKKYHLWLVASKIENPEEKILFDNLKDALRTVLRGNLSKTVLDNVHVFSSDKLRDKLSENDPC